ncbi:PREDICTED: uncharacterized protein LOC105451266 isoform X2 [Wasmannia auropunctata]|uniref:uncharacterized protein LOC105451266 isoform X2 n=1 Tax=Wasmannia auropunctata TaxID=64793 RepID=UPI0005EDB58D|nr:PREDICTED: uncharacterized protein LOC105451266 isoform X2 [Wasmannia auropunctata]
MAKEMPQEKLDWEELPIKKIFDSYEEGMEKLVRAEDTSNVDDTALSSNELKEREKKRRRLKAKKQLSSSSSEEDFIFDQNKENNIRQNKILPALPRKEHFELNKKQLPGSSRENRTILCENSFFNVASSNDLNNDTVTNNSTRV